MIFYTHKKRYISVWGVTLKWPYSFFLTYTNIWGCHLLINYLDFLKLFPWRAKICFLKNWLNRNDIMLWIKYSPILIEKHTLLVLNIIILILGQFKTFFLPPRTSKSLIKPILLINDTLKKLGVHFKTWNCSQVEYIPLLYLWNWAETRNSQIFQKFDNKVYIR